MAIIKLQEVTSVGEDVEKGELLYTVDGNAKCYSHCGKHYGGSSKKVKVKLSYNLAIPLLTIYPKKTNTLIQKDTPSPMFIAALFTIGKIRK